MKPALDLGYPLDWPILKAKDFVRGRIRHGEKCCLEGHLAACFFDDVDYSYLSQSRQRKTMVRKIRRAAKYLGARGKYGWCSDIDISEINDNHSNSLSLLADIWNLAGVLAGYVVGNPMTETLKKMKAK